MTPEQILKNNKMIAIFMCEEVKNGMIVNANNLFGANTHTLQPMQYDSDWSYLMSVVDSIENKGFEVIIRRPISGYPLCEILNKSLDFWCSTSKKSKIDVVYETCVKFIKWYNNDQKTKGNIIN